MGHSCSTWAAQSSPHEAFATDLAAVVSPLREVAPMRFSACNKDR
jgi:hypothetical protein